MALMLLLVVSGCAIWLPYPHTSETSPEVRGRILDLDTKQPVAGAAVMIVGRTNTLVTTDAAGYYHIRAGHSFHLAEMVGPCGGSWPEGNDYVSRLVFSHPAYIEREVSVRDLLPQGAVKKADFKALRDIKLAPKPK